MRNVYSIIFALSAFAPTVLAVPTANVELEPRTCTYATANYLSVCTKGNTLFCTGNDNNLCPAGSKEGYDAHANKANEDACKGLAAGQQCTQTKACNCP